MGIPWWAQLVGALTLVGGACAAFLRGLWRADTQSHSAFCQCPTCNSKRFEEARYRREKKRIAKKRAEAQISDQPQVHRIKPPTERDTDPSYLSTAQLEANMRVEFRGIVYLVKGVKSNTGGYFIELMNTTTRVDFITQVAWSLGNARMWKPVGGVAPNRSTPVLDPVFRVGWDPNAALIVDQPDWRPCIIDGCILRSGHSGDCKFRSTGHGPV